MLGKLLKHELKATSRSFLLMFGVLIGFSIINKLFTFIDIQSMDSNIITLTLQVLVGLMAVGFAFMIMAVFILTAVLIVSRFYKNMTQDEGYLYHTLPVTMHQHILSKTLISLFWAVCSILVFILSLIILSWGYLGDFYEMMDWAFYYLSFVPAAQVNTFYLFLILSIFVTLIQVILMAYLCISIGQLFSKHRILMSIVAYFGISFILQLLSVTVLNPIFEQLYEWSEDWRYLSDVEQLQKVFGYFNASLGLLMLVSLIMSTIYFFLISRIMSKKLNLD